MNWIKRLFGKRIALPIDTPSPERPADWNLTLDDLFAEMKAGKRKSVANPEAQWAREYEQSLIPVGTRFPKKGDLYELKQDQTVQYMTAWAAPFTGGGEAILYKGERIWVHDAPRGERPLGTYALPVEYKKMEERLVPFDQRKSRKFGGLYFYFKTLDLNTDFTLIQEGFRGKKRGIGF